MSISKQKIKVMKCQLAKKKKMSSKINQVSCKINHKYDTFNFNTSKIKL